MIRITRTRSPRELAGLQERFTGRKLVLGAAILTTAGFIAASLAIRPLFKDFKFKSE